MWSSAMNQPYPFPCSHLLILHAWLGGGTTFKRDFLLSCLDLAGVGSWTSCIVSLYYFSLSHCCSARLFKAVCVHICINWLRAFLHYKSTQQVQMLTALFFWQSSQHPCSALKVFRLKQQNCLHVLEIYSSTAGSLIFSAFSTSLEIYFFSIYFMVSIYDPTVFPYCIIKNYLSLV